VISPELPPAHRGHGGAEAHLPDPVGREVARWRQAFGLTFTLPDDLKQVYLGFGNDLAVRNGDPAWQCCPCRRAS
jgi:hypothetical protein